MATPVLTNEQLQEVADAYRRYGSLGYRQLKLKPNTFDSRVRCAVSRGFVTRAERNSLAEPPPQEGLGDSSADELRILKDQLRTIKAAAAARERESLTEEHVKREIIGLSEAAASATPPSWLAPPRMVAAVTGTPTLFASDWHWAEVVQPGQVNHVNAYNITIAHDRARRMVHTATRLLKHHFVKPQYPGIVFALGGDMMSGDIHEELSETNELPLMPALIDLYGVLTWAVDELVNEFGRVFVPCVPGNHGRNTRKPRAKNRAYSNFDWLLYQFLAKRFEDDERVTFYIPDGSDAHWALYDHRYCMTHGDQFRGGDGMIGALGPIIRGDHKKRSRNGQIDLGYDTLMLGHWHQLIQLQRLIVNGSLKGYDEYAAANNFGFEPPQQACWITHPEHGITFSMPIHVEPAPREADQKEWLKWAA